MWNDPAEQRNLVSNKSLWWIKDEVYKWMTDELKDAPLPITSENNQAQMKFYRALLPDYKTNTELDIYELVEPFYRNKKYI